MADKMRIGWIGTGVMGLSMAGHLQAAGWPLEQYESRIVVRHRNVIISLDESSSNKYNNRMQTVIDAVAEAIARKAHSSSTESSRSGQEGGPG